MRFFSWLFHIFRIYYIIVKIVTKSILIYHFLR